MRKNNIKKITKEVLNGKEVTIYHLNKKVFKEAKNHKRINTICPNCASTLALNDDNNWFCTGDKLKIWESEFKNYYDMENAEKAEYLHKISENSRFLELYDFWVYSYEKGSPEEFSCGYTNDLFPIISTIQTNIPDPLVTKRIERKLGRKLTQEELCGEVELFQHNGQILTKYKKNSLQIRIPWVSLPRLETFYP